MGVFGRLTRMIKANINALLDAAEDPEKTLTQLISDMRTEFGERKEQLAQAMVQQKKSERKVMELKAEAAKWKEKAQGALSRGDENLARQCLTQYRAKLEEADLHSKDLEQLTNSVGALKMGVEALEKKMEEAKRRKASLLTRKKVAETTAMVSGAAADMKIPSSFAEFDRVAEKIEDLEIKAGVMAELSGDKMREQVEAATIDHEQLLIDDELSRLKKEMGLLPPAPSESNNGKK